MEKGPFYVVQTLLLTENLRINLSNSKNTLLWAWYPKWTPLKTKTVFKIDKPWQDCRAAMPSPKKGTRRVLPIFQHRQLQVQMKRIADLEQERRVLSRSEGSGPRWGNS